MRASLPRSKNTLPGKLLGRENTSKLVEKISCKIPYQYGKHGYNVELRKTDRINDYGIFMKVSFLKGQRLTVT